MMDERLHIDALYIDPKEAQKTSPGYPFCHRDTGGTKFFIKTQKNNERITLLGLAHVTQAHENSHIRDSLIGVTYRVGFRVSLIGVTYRIRDRVSL